MQAVGLILVLLVCGGVSCLLAAVALSPLLTFVVLFTTGGDILRRWLRRKPARRSYRFDLRALLVGMGAAAVSLGTLKALGDFDDPWSILGNWLMLALPLSLVIAVARYVIDSADERRAEGLAKGQRLAAIQVVEFDRLNSGEEALDTASLVADDSPSLPSPPMPDSPAE